MSCIKDAKKSILDDIFTKYVSNRPSYKRIGADTIEISQTFKNKGANPTYAARQMLISKVKQIAQAYNGHVKAIIQDATYDTGIRATLSINPAYVQHVFDKQVQNKNITIEQGELFDISAQDDINNNTVNFIDSEEYANPSVGYFTKFIEHKENILADYEKRLKETNRQIDAELEKKTVDKPKLAELNNKKRKLKNAIEGVRETGKEGLKQEILELKARANELSVGYYVEKDMTRLDQLVKSNDLNELAEARSIISFYELAGTFVFKADNNNPKGLWLNPFFQEQDVYITGDDGKITNHLKISQEDIDAFQKWANRASNYRIIIDKKTKEAAEKVINEDSGVQKTFGDKQFTVEELTDGSKLKDTHWIDMWTMDITKNIVNKDSLLPQIAFSQLQNETFERANEALKFAARVDEMVDPVLKRLKEIGQTLKKAGIEGLNQGSFSVFLEKTKDGLLTGGYVYKYSKAYTDAKLTVDSNFSKELDAAYVIEDHDEKNAAIKEAFKKRKQWYRINTGIIQFNKIPEIMDDSEFNSWEPFFDREGSEQYKQQLIKVIGEKEYNKQIKEQKKLLREYVAAKQDFIDYAMEEQGIDNFDEMSDFYKQALDRWTIKNSPFYGINNHYEINFAEGNEHGNFQNFNVFVPRRNQVIPTVDPSNSKKLTFKDTGTNINTGYYNEDYEKYIENNDVLYEFHQLLEESMNYVRKTASPEIASKMAVNYLSAMERTTAEIVTNNYDQHNILKRVIPAFKHFWESIRLGFGVKKQSDISYSTRDDITGEKNYRVNDSFLRDNFRAIKDRITIEEAKFLKALGVDNLRRITVSDLNTESLILLNQYLGMKVPLVDIQNGNIMAFRNKLGEGNIDIASIIKDYATHETVRENSFDLPKLIKHFTYQAAYYSAKTEALPRLTVLKNYYDSIENVKKNNLGKPIFNLRKQRNEVQGVRKNAIARFDEHWNRVVLGNTGKEHKVAFGSEKETALFGKTIYSKADRAKLNEINEILGDDKRTSQEIEKNIETLQSMDIEGSKAKQIQEETKTLELVKIKEGLGKARTGTAFYDSLMNWIRYQKLGWNINSGITNFIEGYASNMIVAASGDYFTPKNVYRAYGLMRHSFLKNITYGAKIAETATASKIRILMDRFDVLVDVANELQKSSAKTFAGKTDWLKAMTLTRRVEFINQGVMMLSTLLDQKVTSADSKEVSVFDAMDRDGRLLDEYRTEENVETWENTKGTKYLEYKKNLSNAIELGHGNYDVLKGMMAKSTTAGKALMMFKTWLPMQLYWRFATEQVDLQSGSKGFKGKYWSYGIGSGALHGAAVGTAFAGLPGTIVGGIVGGSWGAFANNKQGRGQDVTGVLQETLTSTIMLVKKMLGMPINTAIGRNVIDTSTGAGIFNFDKTIGKKGFTKEDANALNSNMSDIAIQLTFLALMLMVKSMFWDDDDDDKSGKRQAHNLMVNKLMQLNSQAGGYVNLGSKENVISNTITSIGILKYLADVGKTVADTNKLLHGKDTIESGTETGQSRTWNDFKKSFIPGMLQSPLTGGFKSQMERQFVQSPFDEGFKLHISDKRKELRNTLEEQGASESEIRKRLVDELPTKTFLQKADVKRDDWLKMNEDDKQEILNRLKEIGKENKIKKQQSRLEKREAFAGQ